MPDKDLRGRAPLPLSIACVGSRVQLLLLVDCEPDPTEAAKSHYWRSEGFWTRRQQLRVAKLDVLILIEGCKSPPQVAGRRLAFRCAPLPWSASGHHVLLAGRGRG